MKKIGLLFLAIGVLIGGVSFAVATLALNSHAGWREVEGVVVDVFTTRNSENQRAYIPVVEFDAGKGPLICELAGNTTTRASVGDSTTVRYDPEDPRDCEINPSSWGVWFGYGFGALFLLGFGGVGVALMRAGKGQAARGVGYPPAGTGWAPLEGQDSYQNYPRSDSGPHAEGQDSQGQDSQGQGWDDQGWDDRGHPWR